MEPEHDVVIPEAAEHERTLRSFAAEMTTGKGRTVDVRIVPYGETIEHNDGLGGVPMGVTYREEWMPGVFGHQVRAADKVWMNFEHLQGPRGLMGHGLTLHEGRDGFYGSFEFHKDPEGDKGLLLTREGLLAGVSLEARPRKSIRNVEGIVQRFRADLKAIALCREPAYKNAVVLAIRTPASITEDLLPKPMDPSLVARLSAAGFKIPEHITAHPGTSGHPTESGTPEEDGTRQAEQT